MRAADGRFFGVPARIAARQVPFGCRSSCSKETVANLKQLRPCMFGYNFGLVKFSRDPKINASSTSTTGLWGPDWQRVVEGRARVELKLARVRPGAGTRVMGRVVRTSTSCSFIVRHGSLVVGSLFVPDTAQLQLRWVSSTTDWVTALPGALTASVNARALSDSVSLARQNRHGDRLHVYNSNNVTTCEPKTAARLATYHDTERF